MLREESRDAYCEALRHGGKGVDAMPRSCEMWFVMGSIAIDSPGLLVILDRVARGEGSGVFERDSLRRGELRRQNSLVLAKIDCLESFFEFRMSQQGETFWTIGRINHFSQPHPTTQQTLGDNDL